MKNCFVNVRELVRVARDFDFKNISIFEHFCDVVVNVDRVVDKIVTKKMKKTSNSKNKNFVSCFIVNDLNDNDKNHNNNNDDDFFFRFWLTRFNEQMTTIYVANVVSNNRLTVVMKDVNVLKRVELLRMTMSIEIVVDRKKNYWKKSKKRQKKLKKKRKWQNKNRLMFLTWRDIDISLKKNQFIVKKWKIKMMKMQKCLESSRICIENTSKKRQNEIFRICI